MSGKAKPFRFTKNPIKLVMAMKIESLLLGVLLLIGLAVTNSKATAVMPSRYDTAFLNRSSFPAGFIFGSASASYQVSLSAFNTCFM